LATNVTNGKGTPDQARPQVWSFDRTAGWARIDDPLPAADDHDDDGWLMQHGYFEQLDYRAGTSALSLAVYSHEDDRYIVLLGDAAWHRRVHVDGLPNFVAVLNEVLPAVRGIAELEDREQRDEEERQRRRRGPTVYNPRKRCMEYPKAAH
jgi:hypothetical protein